LWELSLQYENAKQAKDALRYFDMFEREKRGFESFHKAQQSPPDDFSGEGAIRPVALSDWNKETLIASAQPQSVDSMSVKPSATPVSGDDKPKVGKPPSTVSAVAVYQSTSGAQKPSLKESDEIAETKPSDGRTKPPTTETVAKPKPQTEDTEEMSSDATEARESQTDSSARAANERPSSKTEQPSSFTWSSPELPTYPDEEMK
jgi:hypothetical protein